MPSKSVLIAQAFSKTGVLSTVVDSAPSVDTGLEQITSVDNLPTSGNDIGDQLFIENTNRLYIWNGSGWYNIALINTTPTWDPNGQPAALYELDADSPQTATTVTLAASDPEGIPINYSYVTGGSMDSIATVSQDSSVFTITPKTEAQAPDGGTGSITFRASDGVNILPAFSSFTLNFISTIENSRYTTLLVTATGTSDNNNITDSSSNSHSITVNGDTYAGTFSPYHSGGYSTYFDGTGDMLKYENNDYNWGTGNFTIEAWAYLEESGSTRIIFSQRDENGPMIRVNDTGLVRYFRGAGSNQQTSTVQFPIGQWNHVALVRFGTGANQTKVYLNGAEILSFQETTNFSASTARIRIGSYQSAGSEVWKGYITDVRAVKSAIYTAEFTNSLPTNRLEAIANTSLLTCHLPYLADGSTFNNPVIISGTPSTKPFSPYDYDEYSATNHGGSVYFDGNLDYLENTTFSDLTQTSNFTIEAWIYPTARTASNSSIISTRTSGVLGGFDLRYIQNTGALRFYFTREQNSGDTSAIPLNQWSFVSVVRNGTTVDIYVNGNLEASNTSWVDGTLDTGFKIMTSGDNAASSNNCIPGYLSDLRILPSSVSDRNPPTEPLSSTNSLLHIKGTDASIIDKSQSSNLKMFGNTTGSTTQVKFTDSKSMYFDGTGDYITLNETFDEFLESGTVATIEWWGRLVSTTPRGTILSNWYNGSGWTIDYDNNHFIHIARNTSTSYFATNSLSFNVWNHYAIVNNGSGIYGFFNGVLLGSNLTNYTVGANSSGSMRIGQRNDGTLPSEGYIQDLRITKGLARYSQTFTPPSAPLKG
jgi:hypothetical protein